MSECLDDKGRDLCSLRQNAKSVDFTQLDKLRNARKERKKETKQQGIIDQISKKSKSVERQANELMGSMDLHLRDKWTLP
jgi:hypothetical protein